VGGENFRRAQDTILIERDLNASQRGVLPRSGCGKKPNVPLRKRLSENSVIVIKNKSHAMTANIEIPKGCWSFS
jgi:hypothetical protein